MELVTVLHAEAVSPSGTSACTFRQCPTCNKKVHINAWCEHCGDQVESNTTFCLRMSVAVDSRIFWVVLYDATARAVIGCGAAEYAGLGTDVYEETERLLLGEVFEMEISRCSNSDDKVTKIRPMDTFIPVVKRLSRQSHPLQLAASAEHEPGTSHSGVQGGEVGVGEAGDDFSGALQRDPGGEGGGGRRGTWPGELAGSTRGGGGELAKKRGQAAPVGGGGRRRRRIKEGFYALCAAGSDSEDS